jgi:electron transport complex protein RnfG
MRETLKIGLTLTLVCVIAAAALAQVYKFTKVRIDRNMVELEEKKRKEILPQAATFEERQIDGKSLFIGRDAGGQAIGSIFKVAPRGYAGPINILIGVNPDGTAAAVSITKLDQTETPGLGTKITEPKFRDQFKGKEGDALKLKKDGGSIDAITAATISSRAVANGVKEGMDWYKKAVSGER